jgi:hypothetical protein
MRFLASSATVKRAIRPFLQRPPYYWTVCVTSAETLFFEFALPG